MSVGFSRHGQDDYHLELRIDGNSLAAQRMAKAIKNKAPGEVHVGVVEFLNVPSLSDLIEGVQASAPTAVYSSPARPLHIGTSISHGSGGVGTLGAFVLDAHNREALVSNCHVLALAGTADANDRGIYQPGRQDVPQEQLRGGHAIATLCDHTTFSAVGSNYLDAAYAILNEGIEHSGNVVPPDCPGKGNRIDAVIEYDQLGPNQRVAKVGRTTGYTTGVVHAFGVDERIINIPPHGNRRFDDLLEIWWDSLDEPFAKPGDSGSLIYLPDPRQAVALHFAGGVLNINGQRVGVSYACSLSRLLEIFDLTFL